jgi:serine/threonine protein kinase
MVSSLIAMHKCGICHRDVSPQNFVVKEQAGALRCSLIDFGMAARLDVGPNGQPAPLVLTEGFGKPEFVPPEQCLHLHMSYNGFKADVYSLGVTLLFLLTGFGPPFKSPTEASAPYRVIVIENNPRKYFSTRELCGDRVAPSEDALDLISRMLRHRPEDRCSLDDVANHAWCRRTAPVSAIWAPQPPPAASLEGIGQQCSTVKRLSHTNIFCLATKSTGDSREGAGALSELSIGNLDLDRTHDLDRQLSGDSSKYDAAELVAKSSSPSASRSPSLTPNSSSSSDQAVPVASVNLPQDTPPSAAATLLPLSPCPPSMSGDSLGALPSKKLRR